MKMLLVLLFVVEVFLVLLVFSPVFVNRHSASRAFVEWHNNPTPENKSIWEREAAVSRREGYIIDIFSITLLAANSVGLIVLIRKIRKPVVS
jgi:hypothetical protein